MQVKAKLGNLRIAPRKVRLVADLIRRKSVKEAQAILSFTVKKSSEPVKKLLNSAIANAKNNFQIEPGNLYISKITVDEGPKYKRWMPRARGSAYEIQKKTSHITLILDEIKPGEKVKKTARVKKETEAAEELKSEAASVPLQRNFGEPNGKKREWQDTRKVEIPKPKVVKGIRRFFQRKAV